jgi:SAM-dependent methyltransferase
MTRPRRRRKPTHQDLEIWRRVNEDLLDWLYEGPTGEFQKKGHQVIDQWSRPFKRGVVIEVGSGHGHHLRYGTGSHASYVGLDIEHKFLEKMKQRFPGSLPVRGDAYQLPFRNASVDCVLSVYNFEHLRRLPEALQEIRRVLRPGGELLIGLPAEGGMLYGLGRALTSRRYMRRKYRIDYDAIVQWEHWNTYREVEEMVRSDYEILERRSVPFRLLPSVHANVVVCLRTRPRILRETVV